MVVSEWISKKKISSSLSSSLIGKQKSKIPWLKRRKICINNCLDFIEKKTNFVISSFINPCEDLLWTTTANFHHISCSLFIYYFSFKLDRIVKSLMMMIIENITKLVPNRNSYGVYICFTVFFFFFFFMCKSIIHINITITMAKTKTIIWNKKKTTTKLLLNSKQLFFTVPNTQKVSWFNTLQDCDSITFLWSTTTTTTKKFLFGYGKKKSC